MNKRALILKVIAKLRSELAVYFRAAQNSRVEATDEWTTGQTCGLAGFDVGE